MAERNSGDVFLAFLIGGLIGAAVGILYAPNSGKNTRQKIRKKGEDLSEKFENISDEVKNTAKQVVADGKEKIVSSKERLEEVFDAGRKAFERK